MCLFLFLFFFGHLGCKWGPPAFSRNQRSPRCSQGSDSSPGTWQSQTSGCRHASLEPVKPLEFAWKISAVRFKELRSLPSASAKPASHKFIYIYISVSDIFPSDSAKLESTWCTWRWGARSQQKLPQRLTHLGLPCFCSSGYLAKGDDGIKKTSWVAMLVIKKGHRKTMNDTYSVYSTHPPSQADHVRNHCHRLSGFLQYELHTHGIITDLCWCPSVLDSHVREASRTTSLQVWHMDDWHTITKIY